MFILLRRMDWPDIGLCSRRRYLSVYKGNTNICCCLANVAMSSLAILYHLLRQCPFAGRMWHGGLFQVARPSPLAFPFLQYDMLKCSKRENLAYHLTFLKTKSRFSNPLKLFEFFRRGLQFSTINTINNSFIQQFIKRRFEIYSLLMSLCSR